MSKVLIGSALIAIIVGVVGELLRERWAAERVYSEYGNSWYADDRWNMGAFLLITLAAFVVCVIVGIAIMVKDRR